MPKNSSEIKERARLIRNATPDILEELFEMSNRRCDLCGHEIQDLMLAALDHSTPVISFARSDMPIAKAIRWCNDPKNLRVAHSSCNTAKQEFTREEWFARGLNNREAPRVLTDGELLLFQFQLGAGGRIGGRRVHELHPELAAQNGRIAGRKHFENKTGVFNRSPEKMSADGRKGGRKAKTAGTGIFAMTPEQTSAAGCKGGHATASIPGHFARIGSMGGRIGGSIAGRIAVESGQLAKYRTLEHQVAAGRKGGRIGSRIINHRRWHVRRGISNPECALCQVA